MSKNLNGKTVVITGGADGIGFQIGSHFLKNGAKTLIILDINEEFGAKAVQKLRAEYANASVQFMKCDVSNDLEKVYKDITDTYKTVDVLVNNAGVGRTPELRKIIEINLLAVMEWSTKFLEHMSIDKGGKGGTIINIASVYGFRSDSLIPPDYTATKHGVVGWTKSLGHSDYYKTQAVRVLAICPGFTRTSLVARFYKREKVDSLIWQQPEDVGRAAVEVFNEAESGTVWIAQGGKPVEQLRDSDQ